VKSASRLRELCTPNMLASTLPSTLRKEGAGGWSLFSGFIDDLVLWIARYCTGHLSVCKKTLVNARESVRQASRPDLSVHKRHFGQSCQFMQPINWLNFLEVMPIFMSARENPLLPI
jgi:hypothetical protein